MYSLVMKVYPDLMKATDEDISKLKTTIKDIYIARGKFFEHLCLTSFFSMTTSGGIMFGVEDTQDMGTCFYIEARMDGSVLYHDGINENNVILIEPNSEC